MEDLKGQIIGAKERPKLNDFGMFEGLADFKFYEDAVEYAGVCVHCKTVVGGVLRLEDPKMKRKVRGLLEEAQLKGVCANLMRQNHQCGFNAEGKKDVDQWLRELKS